MIVEELSLARFVDDVVVAVLGVTGGEVFGVQFALAADPLEDRLRQVDDIMADAEIGDGVDVGCAELILEDEGVAAIAAGEHVVAEPAVQLVLSAAAGRARRCRCHPSVCLLPSIPSIVSLPTPAGEVRVPGCR